MAGITNGAAVLAPPRLPAVRGRLVDRPVEGGKRVLPQLGLGPFIYRAAAYMTPAQRDHFPDLLTPETIGRRLRAVCPAAVLVGFEGPLDAPLATFAAEQHYRPEPVTLRGAGRPGALLFVRPPVIAQCA